MCGYVGFTNNIKDGSEREILQAMSDSIAHRGPDSQGAYIDEDICMGFRRLSIIDLADGDQPMTNEDGSLVLTFNGEIYNFKELREALAALGHVFKTRSDSEVLLHGYEAYGTALVDRLRGMFSFVIWDKASGTLFGARDPFGIKPLYYATMGDVFLFGSEIKAFLHHPSFEKKLNERALASYLSFQYSPGQETFFEGVYKLPAAHYFILKEGRLETTRYWRPHFESVEDTFEAYARRTDQAIRESVQAHKISDVEVGSFLSSGIDSSYISATAQVDKTFTVGFTDDGDRYDETYFAASFSKFIDVKNISKRITPEEYWETFPKIQYHMDEPLADPAAVALYFVSKLAAEHVKVVLSGEGADELFGGYRIYQEPITTTPYDRLPFGLRRFIAKLAAHLPPVRGINYIVRRGQTIEERFIGNAQIFTKKEREKLLRIPDAAPTPAALCKPYYDEAADQDTITKMQYLDIHMWLMGDILLKADKTSMANSLELRVPFLDKEVMKLASQIPTGYRVDTKTTKRVLRAAASQVLPAHTAEKKKLGFPVPIRLWLKDEQYGARVRAAFAGQVAQQFFNTARLQKLMDDHVKGKTDNSRKIWTVYTFLVWYEQFFGA